jgi:hypothetical protein
MNTLHALSHLFLTTTVRETLFLAPCIGEKSEIHALTDPRRSSRLVMALVLNAGRWASLPDSQVLYCFLVFMRDMLSGGRQTQE